MFVTHVRFRLRINGAKNRSTVFPVLRIHIIISRYDICDCVTVDIMIHIFYCIKKLYRERVCRYKKNRFMKEYCRLQVAFLVFYYYYFYHCCCHIILVLVARIFNAFGRRRQWPISLKFHLYLRYVDNSIPAEYYCIM